MEVSSSAYANAVTVRPVPARVQCLWWLFILGIGSASLCYLPLSRPTVAAMVSLLMLAVLVQALLTRRDHRAIISITIGSSGRIEALLRADARSHVFAGARLSDHDEAGWNVDMPSPTVHRAGVFILIGQYRRAGGRWIACHSAGLAPEQCKRLRLFLLDPRFTPVLSSVRQRDAATGV